MARLGLGLVGFAVFGLIVVLAIAMQQGVGGLAQGRTSDRLGAAPDFTLTQFDGQSFTLRDKQEQPVFLYFWASWCIPCKEEAVVIERLWPAFRDRGWVFLGVNIWDAERDARRFVDQQQLTFPLASDPDGRASIDYGVQALPTSFFIKPGGQFNARYDGPLSEAVLRRLLEEVTPR